MPKYSFQREGPLSPDEVRGMIETSDTMILKALIAFLYLYGTRIGEALSLKKSDFVILKHALRVNIAVEKKRSKTSPIVWKHPLEVKFSPSNQYFMDKILSHLIEVKGDERIFRFSRITAWRKIHRLNSKCSPHIFRHTRNRRLAARGADALVLMDWNGWSDPRPAGAYLGLSGAAARKFAGKID